MREISSQREMLLSSQRAKSHDRKVGFVPTMGALHEGHLSLVAEAKKRTDIVVVSIFVNPIQFGPSEDLNRYPRDLRRDRRLLKNFDVDILFLPQAGKMFPAGFNTFVEVETIAKKLCGRTRPTHFRGVTTVVAKLFNLVEPNIAFFGAKDWQQQLIIRQMARDLNFPVEIATLPTVREFDGLAMSSRNKYLSERERKSAAILFQALSLTQREVAAGERDLNKLLFRMRSLIGSEPTVRIDYLTAVDPETLVEVKKLKGQVLFALAAYVGKTRLIDNILVEA